MRVSVDNQAQLGAKYKGCVNTPFQYIDPFEFRVAPAPTLWIWAVTDIQAINID